MSQRAHRFSIFSQSLDRAAFLSYLLGAVVPFLALAIVVHRFVLPALPDGAWGPALISLTVSIGGLSGAAFFALRRVTWQTVERMARDNVRLSALLETSSTLATATHSGEIASATAACAVRLTEARAAFFVSGRGGEAVPKIDAAAGETQHLESIEPVLADILEQAQAEERPTLWRASPGAFGSDPSAPVGCAIVPVEGVGAIFVVTSRNPSQEMDGSDLNSLATLAALASVAIRNARLGDAQRNFFVHVTDILVAALDAHMDLQSGHARRVAHIANQLGRKLDLGEETRQRLHFASLLHDVGMLKVDSRLHHEKRANRQHPTLGFRMLSPIQLWGDIAPIVLHHHEWWDGGGYPEGLSGNDIPLESRIIGLAEAFDSMTGESSYKASIDFEEAVRRIDQASGTQFDPEIARLFLELAGRGEIGPPR